MTVKKEKHFKISGFIKLNNFKWVLCILFLFIGLGKSFAQKYELFSSNKTKHVIVELKNDSVSYSFFMDGISVIDKSLLSG